MMNASRCGGANLKDAVGDGSSPMTLPILQAINTSRLTEIKRATKLQHERLADELREAGR